jgi:hypothetical protein
MENITKLFFVPVNKFIFFRNRFYRMVESKINIESFQDEWQNSNKLIKLIGNEYFTS